jgi:hypothetical protein
MRQIITIFFLIFAVSCFGQSQYGDFKNINLRSRMYSNAYDLIVAHPDSTGQFLYQNAADPETNLGLVNVRYLEANYMASEVVDDSINAKIAREQLTGIENLYLKQGGNRIISVRYADGGSTGDDLTVKAGDNDDNLGGGDLWLRGGGTLEEYGDVNIGANLYDETNSSLIYIWDTIYMNGNSIRGLNEAVNDDEPVTLSQIEGFTQSVYSIGLPNASSVNGRVTGATEGADYPTGWVLAAAGNNIDLVVTHGTGRRVAEVNVLSVNGTIEQLLRPYAGAYSGWQTNDANTLQINGLATIPLAIKIYIIFE